MTQTDSIFIYKDDNEWIYYIKSLFQGMFKVLFQQTLNYSFRVMKLLKM